MAFEFRTVAATATSLFAIGVLSTCSPGTKAWANDSIKEPVSSEAITEIVRDPISTIIPDPESTPAVPAEEIERKIAEPAETKTTRRAGSLAELVKRHAATSTSSREAECLAGAIYFESKSEHVDGQLAVAQTIINRAKSGRFASSNCGVVFQRGQFSFVRGGGFPPIARSGQQWKTAVAVAHIAMNNLWSSSVSNALFFHARHVSPGWRLKRIASLGNHVFYR